MASVTFAINEGIKIRMKKFSWINWSNVAKEEIERKARLLKLVDSKEQREIIRWSVELGRKSRKSRWNELLKQLTPEEREELLDK